MIVFYIKMARKGAFLAPRAVESAPSVGALGEDAHHSTLYCRVGAQRPRPAGNNSFSLGVS
jgi:hypothetical protein